MSIAKLRRELTKLRFDRGHTTVDMANRLEISTSYLNAIQYGGRKIPSDFVNKLSTEYKLSKAEEKKFKSIALKAQGNITIKPKNVLHKQLIQSFLKFANSLTPQEMEEELRKYSER